jgi:hypothetical protein
MVKRKKAQRMNNDLQNTMQKTKYRATRTALTPRLNTGAPEGKAVPATLMEPAR